LKIKSPSEHHPWQGFTFILFDQFTLDDILGFSNSILLLAKNFYLHYARLSKNFLILQLRKNLGFYPQSLSFEENHIKKSDKSKKAHSSIFHISLETNLISTQFIVLSALS